MRSPVPIVALDVPRLDAARSLLERIGPDAVWVKVGLQLFMAAGPEAVRELRAAGHRVFLDLKLHDIPNTVERAIEGAAELGVELLTVHAAGGAAMLRAARRAAGEPGAGGPQIFAVTVLTSLSEAEVVEVWGRGGASTVSHVARLALLARDAGADGVVASVWEAERIRAVCGTGLSLLAPGIRLAGDPVADQARVATPADAARAGVDYLVVGRSVTAAPDPAAAFRRVRDEIAAASEPAGVA